MSESIESRNKAIAYEAFDTLFNKRDDAAAELAQPDRRKIGRVKKGDGDLFSARIYQK
jgi:hypothetical protein